MKTTALRLAEHIIYLAKENNKNITNLGLRSVLYHLWVEYYRSYKEYLFDESFYAWQLGTVVPEVYYEYCLWTAHDLQPHYSFEEAPISNEELRSRIDSTIIELLSKNTYELYTMNFASKAWKERRELYTKYHSDGEMSFARIIALDVREDTGQ